MMTREEMAREIERLGPWFHRIELPGGLLTKTASVHGEPADHPLGTWEIVRRALPASLAGKTVLDVGCNAGFYSIEAKRRGAARVLGVDAMRHSVRQALFVRRALGIDVEYRRRSVYDLHAGREGRFNVVLALGLIYHCKHLARALERLARVTGEMLLLETAVLPASLDSGYRGLAHLYAGEVRALGLVSHAGHVPEALANWFVPSLAAAQELLHEAGFASVDVLDASRGRAVLLCRAAAPVPSDTVDCVLRAAEIHLLDGPLIWPAGDEVDWIVRLDNEGDDPWPARRGLESPQGRVRVGAHLFRSDGEEVEWDFARADLMADVAPGRTATVRLRFDAPRTAGRYAIEIDLVQEGLAWFEDSGTRTLRQEIIVSTSPHRGDRMPLPGD